MYDRAETLRGEALAALAALRTVGEGGKGPPALESAQTAEAKLVELQRLFFSVPEHLKQLIRDQGETADRTAEAVAMDDLARRPALPPLVQREREHEQLGDAIAQAIAAQADAAAQQAQQAQPGQPAPQANPNLQEAAREVRNAVVSMQDAAETLGKAADPSATMSFDLSPVQDAQKTAIEHLENALRLLQPPKQQQDDGKGQGQDQPQPQDPKPGQGQPDPSQTKEDAERRLQQVREREAQRQRERKERQRMAPEPVDKDW